MKKHLFEPHDEPALENGAGCASVLARRMTRLYFARQQASIEIASHATNQFLENNSADSLASLQQTIQKLLHKSTSVSEADLAHNPFTEPENEVRMLLGDYLQYLQSNFVAENRESEMVQQTIRAFPGLLHTSHRWESWAIAGSALYSQAELKQVTERMGGVLGKIQRWRKEMMTESCGALISFRYYRPEVMNTFKAFLAADAGKLDEGAPRWLRTPQWLRDRRMQQAAKWVMKAARNTVAEMENSFDLLLPHEPPLDIATFRNSQATPLPDDLLDKVVELEESHLVSAESSETLMTGFVSIIPRDVLHARVHTHDATVICLERGEDLVATFFLCSDLGKMPELGRDLQGLLRTQLEVEGVEQESLHAPVLLCDLVVKQKGSERLRRSHGEDPYGIITDQFIAAVEAEHAFEPVVHCVGICRKEPTENHALEAHKRMGWKVLPGVVYCDSEGQNHYVLHLEINPLRDLLR